jgi:NAD(P)-dependent dehydrogenase (short-subunit alcohol dehydrogenase family)
MHKTIFITGASSGLGKATAQLFHAKGWHVIATMRQPDQATELRQLPGITLLPLDVTDPAQITETVAQALALHPVNVVFNNAGYGLSGPLEGTSDEQLTRQLNTNLLGVIRVTKAFIPYFREQGRGLFITTTSIGGLIGFPFSSVYHAAKWGLEGWTESMSFELAKLGIGIKTVAPGPIHTDFMSRSYDHATHPAYEQWVNAFFAQAGGMTFASADSIAAVVYEAATDGKDQLRYVAGDVATALYNKRLELGQQGFYQFMTENFFSE